MLSPLALLALALAQDPSPPLAEPEPPLAEPAPPVPPAPALDPAPAPAPVSVADPFARPNDPPARRRLTEADIPESVTHRRLAFSATAGVNLGILYGTPSGELALFLGSTLLPRRTDSFDWHTAIGYQGSLSYGGAEDSTYEASPSRVSAGERRFFHRHHLTATGYGGRQGRLYFSVGGGVWMWLAEFGGFEGQGRLGVRFAVREGNRLSGVFGGQVRLTGAVSGAPMPQFGLFLGLLVF